MEGNQTSARFNLPVLSTRGRRGSRLRGILSRGGMGRLGNAWNAGGRKWRRGIRASFLPVGGMPASSLAQLAASIVLLSYLGSRGRLRRERRIGARAPRGYVRKVYPWQVSSPGQRSSIGGPSWISTAGGGGGGARLDLILLGGTTEGMGVHGVERRTLPPSQPRERYRLARKRIAS